MDTLSLTTRLRAAAARHSLRTLALWTELSHETIRKFVLAGVGDTLSIARYNKIDKGLTANGF